MAYEDMATSLWQQKKDRDSFSELDFTQQVDMVEDFFPARSIAREKILFEEIDHRSEEDKYYILSRLQIPFFQDQLRDQLWGMFLDEHADNDVNELFQKLLELYPTASFHRDEQINALLLTYPTNYAWVQEIKREHMYSGNTLVHTDDEQLLSLMLLRVYGSIAYFLPSDMKYKGFRNIIEGIRNEDSLLSAFGLSDKREIFRTLFL
ncbi:MAG: hypothetical protein H6767_00405 [Candidatus Peribacteria bacterium]|nr:MAG: hypothetical protein H6767_00405 [Candidatus Peribacteria bacterium]